MIFTRFFIICFLFGYLSGALSVAASAAEAQGIMGFPAKNTSSKSDVIGLTDSTQWISELTASYLYIGYNSAHMASNQFTTTDYVTTFTHTRFAYPSLDYFSHLFSMANPESKSFFHNLSFWGRYGLGFAQRKGSLANTSTWIDSSLETGTLLIFTARLGALLSFDILSWVHPYAGLEITPYTFRHTSDLSGTEVQGYSFTWGPVVGVHLPILFGGRVAFFAEARNSIAAKRGRQLFTNSREFTGGAGFAF